MAGRAGRMVRISLEPMKDVVFVSRYYRSLWEAVIKF